MKNKTRLNVLIECSLAVALSTVLSAVTLFKMPLGGSVTLFSMCPVVTTSFRLGVKYGVFTGLIYSVVQMISGFHVPPVKSAGVLLVVALLDYVIPYACLGLAAITLKFIKNRRRAILSGTILVTFIRYLSSVVSGVLIWRDSSSPLSLALSYSLTYNGLYMVPEIILTSLGCLVVDKYVNYEKG